MTRLLTLLLGLLLGLATPGPTRATADPPESALTAPTTAGTSRAASQAVPVPAVPQLPNLHRLPGDLLSGGLPADEAAFRELQQLGVKTVISVDGAPPDVSLAERFGMRYVHLPIGYDGVPPRRARELAQAVTTLPRPIYFHCHHGKHRSPAAAVVACIATGSVAPAAAQATLEQMGTDPHYVGLYQAARRAEPLPSDEQAEKTFTLPSRVAPPPLVEVMLEIERLRDRLAHQLARWERDASRGQPNRKDAPRDGSRLALLLQEQLVEMQRLQTSSFASSAEAPGGEELLTQSIQHAAALKTAWQKAAPAGPTKQLRSAWQRVQHDCRACHRRFRDPPP